MQKWSLGDCFNCWRLPPLTCFLLYQRHSWLDRKACWLAPSHPACFCTSRLCSAGSCSYSFFMTFPHYTLFNCSLFLWPWSPAGQSKRSGTVFISYHLKRLETQGHFSAKKFVCMCSFYFFIIYYLAQCCRLFLQPASNSWILVLNDSCLQMFYIWYMCGCFIKNWIID